MLLRSGRRVATQEEAGRTTVPRRRSRARPDRLAGFPEEITAPPLDSPEPSQMLLRSRRRAATQEEAGRATVTQRRSRARPDRLAGFPEEILQEILVRLPAKYVLRCRAVCQLWRRLSSDPYFLQAHHRRQPELSLISFVSSADGAVNCPRLKGLNLRDSELRPVFGFPEIFHYHFRITVRASCDGLFVAGHYICNPATRQCARLSSNPKLSVDHLLGLFRHQPSGEYRVLYWRNLPSVKRRVHRGHEYHVLTVGTSGSSRVDCPLTEENVEGPTAIGASVLLNGSLHIHWRRRSGDRSDNILVFDTVAETFRHMIPPPVSPCHGGMHLFDMGGKLAVSTTSKGDMAEMMSIFMLQSGEHNVWAFQYQIELPVMELRHFGEARFWWANVVSKEGDVLLSCYRQALHCDKEGNLVASFKFHDDMPLVFHHRLKESLIQHKFFQKKN